MFLKPGEPNHAPRFSYLSAGKQLHAFLPSTCSYHDVHLWANSYRGTLEDIFDIQETEADFEKLQSIFNTIQENYSSALNDFYKEAQDAPIEDLDITTALNFNRELFTSNKAILMAVKDFLLAEKEAEDFNEIPVYKT